MFCLISLLVIWGLSSFLFSLIGSNPWLWILWVFLGLLATILLFFGWLYGMALPFVRYGKDGKAKLWLIMRIVNFVNLMCGAILVVEGKENLVAENRVLLVSNHKSQLDVVLLYAAAKKLGTAAGKSSLWKVKPLLPLINAFEVLKIDRNNDRETAKSIIQGIKLLKKDKPIIIFPEGGIKTREVEQMVSLKAGAYKLATKSDAIIQPAAIIGSSKLAKRKPWQWFKIIVRFLPAIRPEDYAGMTTHEIGYKVIEMVNKEFPNEKKYQIDESNEL